MDSILRKIKNIQAEACVTIIMNTHRTRPDNERDPLLLKNLLKDAEKRLYDTYPKRFVWPIMENLQKVADQVDHNFNLESLIIFANQEVAEFTRLPIRVADRVEIDNSFTTRDLIRALHLETAYYVLVLSRQNARLIEAFNDKVVIELGGDFPMKNNLSAVGRQDQSNRKDPDNLFEEFFNRVDKTVQNVIKENPLPILLATETGNMHTYLRMADNKHNIIGHIKRNRDDEKAHHIISDAWDVVKSITRERTAERITEFHRAIGSGKVLTGFTEIWNAIQHGRGQTLFIKKGLYQPAIFIDNTIIPVEKFEKGQINVIDDIFDELIELNLAFGGDNVFIEGNELEKFGNIALVVRY